MNVFSHKSKIRKNITGGMYGYSLFQLWNLTLVKKVELFIYLLTQLPEWVICYPELSPACLVSTEIVLYLHTILVPGSFFWGVQITVWSYPADIPVSSTICCAVNHHSENNIALTVFVFISGVGRCMEQWMSINYWSLLKHMYISDAVHQLNASLLNAAFKKS